MKAHKYQQMKQFVFPLELSNFQYLNAHLLEVTYKF